MVVGGVELGYVYVVVFFDGGYVFVYGCYIIDFFVFGDEG